jgi:hypothetical protein
MAGDPHKNGGFVILNGIRFDGEGRIVLMDEPYPGSNIFSLASGGAVYVRDPMKTLVEQQLNGGVIEQINKKDWELILPYLEENQRLFNINIDDLLTVDGVKQSPLRVYRKVIPASAAGASGPDLYGDEIPEEEVFCEKEPVLAK